MGDVELQDLLDLAKLGDKGAKAEYDKRMAEKMAKKKKEEEALKNMGLK